MRDSLGGAAIDGEDAVALLDPAVSVGQSPGNDLVDLFQWKKETLPYLKFYSIVTMRELTVMSLLS